MKGPSEPTRRIGAIPPLRWSVGIVAALLGCVPTTPTEGGSTQEILPSIEGTFELSAGVVIDPAAHAAYVMSEKGGIDAVDLESGERRWHSDRGDKPIALVDTLLLAMVAATSKGRVLGLAVLDVQADGRSVRTRTVDLPASVVTGVDDLLTSEFLVGGSPAGREVVVSWAFASHPERASGTPPAGWTEGVTHDPPVERGAFRINPTSNATSGAAPRLDLAPPLASRPLPATARLPINKGDQYLSGDRSHVLSAARFARDAIENRYVWTITDRTSGRELGQTRTRWSSGPFFMSSTKVIFLTRPFSRMVGGRLVEEGVRVRAVDLTSGKERWAWPIRNTAYRGRLPD